MPPRRGARTTRPATKPSLSPSARPSSLPQGHTLYRGSRARPHHRADPSPRHPPRARAPSFASGLSVARARVRDVPWDAAHWTELADLLYRKGEFDLAAKAYKRVQEIYAEGHAPRHRKAPIPSELPTTAVPGAAVSPPKPESTAAVQDAPPPSASAPAVDEPAVAIPKVPIITSTTGQTRAIRLPGTNIMIAVTGLAPSPSTLPPPRRLRPDEPEERPENDSSRPAAPRTHHAHHGPAASPRTASQARPPPVEEKIRSVLEQDMVRFLQIFDKGSSPPQRKKSPEASGEETGASQADPSTEPDPE